MKVYKIYDWAGNDKTSYYGIFEHIDDAWDRLFEEFEHLSEEELDEQLGEFYVELVKQGE